MTILTDGFVRTHVILRTSRARCALYKEIIDLFNKESISGARSGRASLYNSTRSLPRVFEKVSRPLKWHSNFFGGHIYTYMYIYGYVKRGSTVFKVQKDGCGVPRALLGPEGLLMW